MENKGLEGYRELKNYREGKKFYTKEDIKPNKMLTYGIAGAVILGTTIFMIPGIIDPNYGIISKLMCGTMTALIDMGWAVIAISHIDTLEKYIANPMMFKEKYPNVDMDITDEKLEKVLEYSDDKKLEETKKKFEEQSNQFNNMSTREKITYLKEQKEFWEAVSVIDDYKEKNKVKTK
ncbi:MAG: hypothetical protein Q4E69_02845 [Bacilli bacterium]|nr:hypothetical protein [Bacilli bacterium]